MKKWSNIQWQVTFNSGIAIEDARQLSLPGSVMPESSALFFTGDMADLSKFVPDYVPGRSTAVVRGVLEAPEDARIIIGAGADWWLSGFINGTPFGDTEAAGNCSYPVGAMDQLYMADVRKGENIITFHLRAGRYWLFGTKIIPVPQEWPHTLRESNRLALAMFKDDFGMVREPLVFNTGGDRVSMSLEFSLPALCGIRYTPSAGGKTVETWNKFYGMREYRNIHYFEFTGLSADTSYNYEVLLQDEARGAVDVIYSGTFTTFPDRAAEHRFAVLSDVQFPSAEKRQAIADFVNNTELKKADFIVPLGDMASGFGNFAEAYFSDFIDILRANGANQTLEIVRGNHELWGSEAILYAKYFGCPYGAFTYGDVFYIRLDSGEDQAPKLSPFNQTQKSDFAEFYAEEAAWLEQVAASAKFCNARKRIILSHSTPFECHEDYTAQNLENMLGKLFYGEKPAYKIDLWIAGHIHYPMRFDPLSGEIYGLREGKPVHSPTEKDLKNIHFPVYVNDGPLGGGHDLSMLDICCRADDIVIRYTLPDGSVADEVVIAPGKPVEVIKSEFKLLWSK